MNLHTLVITNISYNDAGKYQCKAWNKYGMTHACTNINVISATGIRGGKPPMFITRPETIMCVNSGSDVSVSFRLSGDPKPKSKSEIPAEYEPSKKQKLSIKRSTTIENN